MQIPSQQTSPGDRVQADAPASYTACHWGIYEVRPDDAGGIRLTGFARDPAPSPIGLSMPQAVSGPLRVRQPAVRQSWLDAMRGRSTDTRRELRGQERFVEVSWDEALDLVAAELERVRGTHGNASIFGGSYGWSSAGRFHHAQSQVHRFLNAVGGYVRHADTYSLGAARVLMPHIAAPMEEQFTAHTSWGVMIEHTRLFVSFGGVPAKNAQVSSGGAGEHLVPGALRRMAQAGVRFINVSPVRCDIDTGAAVEWIPIRPNTDTALLLALAHQLYAEGLHDAGFLATHSVGFERFLPYLLGEVDGQPKDASWASAITGIPAARIVALAREMAATRTMLSMAWSLQRAHHGEQPYWSLVTLACMLGQIGLPGGGFAVGYGAANVMGNANARFSGPTLPQGSNPVRAFIPVARVTDMLEKPGQGFRYNGQDHRYPDIRLIYWAGGNPFHHHQDLNRLLAAWQSKPETIVVHEQYWTATAKLADIVLPATSALERDDIGYAAGDRYMVAMKQAIEPVAGARDDYEIFSALAQRMGEGARFTEGVSARQWIEQLYAESRERAARAGHALPPFDAFWAQGIIDLSLPQGSVVMFEAFRRDPGRHPLATPSGRFEIFSQRIHDFGEADCPGHAHWFEPIEWLGAASAAQFPLHLLTDQPFTKLHSQLDHAAYSGSNKIAGREPIMVSRHDARARQLVDGDVVRVFNARGTCLAAVRVSDDLMPGVVKLSTGAWFDPSHWRAQGPQNVEKHGNPNVLTVDMPASGLSQGCMAQTCLVEIAKVQGSAPAPTPYRLPEIVRLPDPAQGAEGAAGPLRERSAALA